MSPSDRPRSPWPTVDEPIAVVGATGEQGGAVARTLLARGTPVRAIVRDPEAERARALATAGAQLVVADLTDESSLRAAFDGAPAVFAMASPTPDGGVVAEAEHGKAIARAAAAVAVPHVVYSSVGGVERSSGIPHFESKLEVEQTPLQLGVPCAFIRPVFFMDNFVRFMAPAEEDGMILLRLPMPGDVPLQMIAVVDVAAVSVVALLEPGRIPDGAIEIAGDELTGEQAAATFGELRGLPARFEELPTSVLDPDTQAMFEWFANPPAYQADFAATRALDPQVLTFAQWLKTVV
jgi:uncharacterized protein YbjT (DUF2867 family)